MKLQIVVEQITATQYRASCPLLNLVNKAAKRDTALKALLKSVNVLMSAKKVELLLHEVDGVDLQVSLEGEVKPRTHEADEVLFLIPSNLKRPFFAELLQWCEAKINDVFRDKLRSVLRYVPRDEQSFDPKTFASLLRREFEWSRRIRMVVVAPTASKELSVAICEVLKQQKRPIPIVAITLPLHDKVFTDHKLEMPPCVMCDSEKGAQDLGEDAAKRLASHRGGINVLLIRGEKGRKDSEDRINGFLNGLRTGINELEIIEGERPHYCNWNGHLARKLFKRLVEEKSRDIHVVFAANDEMAIAVRETIDDFPPNIQRRVKNCLIYGFDAIDEMKRGIHRNDPHLKGTVRQPLEDMAERIVGLMDQALRSDPQPLVSYFAKPEKVTYENHDPTIEPPPPRGGNEEQFLTTGEAAKQWGVQRETLMRRAREAQKSFDERDNRWGYCRIEKVLRKFWFDDSKGHSWWNPPAE
jgi:ABC-type sugar transport system substrate-binding protein